jgi:serine phosphatase RsbU (regulator of sigma subunit)
VALVVGDLAGHGAHVAARAAGLRFGWRTLVAVDPEPGAVVSSLNAQLGDREERSKGIFASLLYAIVDPASGEVAFAQCGHPPPIILTAEQAVAERSADRGPLLGVFDDATWPVARAVLPPGGTLVVYTDGLVEARRETDLFGVERACAVLWENRRAALEERLALVVDAARRHDDENLRDDVVVLAVERPVPVSPEADERGLEPARADG